MCGIFGQLTTKAPDPNRARLLALLNQSRGKDAVGFLGVNVKDGAIDSYRWWKHNSKTKEALQAHADDIGALVTCNLLLGHTRLGTKGSNTTRNAHPFVVKNIIGAHNGMIYNDHLLGDGKHQVDSEVIFQLLQSYGTKGFKQLEGYGAIWWIDSNDPKYFWLWMDSGELAYWRSKDRSEFVFSSDWRHLVSVGIPKNEIKEVQSGNILRISLKTLAIKVTHEHMAATTRYSAKDYALTCGAWDYEYTEVEDKASEIDDNLPKRLWCSCCDMDVDVEDWIAMGDYANADCCPYCNQPTLLFDCEVPDGLQESGRILEETKRSPQTQRALS